ncbi:hypothetical protein [Haloactinomyces albus]|uniref:Uncharacterized protein n=1 Tax=Haloactinomyces albus TaxID=1352928 RepID=A0AAE3ZHE5_9ACTN|nr:hypothetical protein [Haloactinomyces albus]MDR7303262.1 hypothetical protein [Haloactinomyces albus]
MKPELDLPRANPCESGLTDVPSMRAPAACSDGELLAEIRECEAVVRRALAEQYALMAEVERRGLYG